MIRRPPRSTRTDTIFPYTTLFRSPTYADIAEVIDHPTKNIERKARHSVKVNGLEVGFFGEFGVQHFTQGVGKMLHRSEEHTSELQSLMRISYAVFCLKQKNLIQLEQYRPSEHNPHI